MTDFFFRTEDIKPDEVLAYFVETSQDRTIVNAIKNRNPTILVGSRGVGKSFLLRVAQKELLDEFDDSRVFPIYISFVRSSLLISPDPEQFKHWMLAKICSVTLRSLEKAGLLGSTPRSLKLLAGEEPSSTIKTTKVESIADAYEDSWKNPGQVISVDDLPSIDDLKDALEDLASELGIERFSLLIDEAAHIFLPEQQRQFFTLFRDLRSHCLTCNAAVYPGVTSFGETFQPVHDATMISIERDILGADYVENMREIVEKQADSKTLENIARNGRNFATLAYAASGNPRILLKTVAAAPSIGSTQINEIIRSYYRTDIWAEHSVLAEKYAGHRDIIDWGRQFIEGYVLPELKSKNDHYMETDRSTSAYLWIHRDTPEIAKEALRVLAYTGILSEQASGIKASRGEIGKRYVVNLGCLFALEPTPASTSFDIARSLTPKRMTEFGANHPAYRRLVDRVGGLAGQAPAFVLKAQLDKSVDVLDITDWQKAKLHELELETVGQVLEATEAKLKEASYVGDKRARRMRNAAVAAVLEYLSG